MPNTSLTESPHHTERTPRAFDESARWRVPVAQGLALVAMLLSLEGLLGWTGVMNPIIPWPQSSSWVPNKFGGFTPASSVVWMVLALSALLSTVEVRRESLQRFIGRASLSAASLAGVVALLRVIDVASQALRGSGQSQGILAIDGVFVFDWLIASARVQESVAVTSFTLVGSLIVGLLASALWMARYPAVTVERRRALHAVLGAVVAIGLLGSVGLQSIASTGEASPMLTALGLNSLLVALLIASSIGFGFTTAAPQPACTSRNLVVRPVAAAIAVIAVGVVTTHFATEHERELRRANALARSAQLAERADAQIRQRAALPLYMLDALRGLFIASKSVERLEFNAFVESWDLKEQYPGCLGFGFIERVAPSALDAWIEMQRADSAPEFTTTPFQHEDPSRHNWIISFLAPASARQGVRGYDASGDPVRRAALKEAVATGQPVVTQRVTLVQDFEPDAGVLYLLPVYRNLADLSTAESRNEALLGVLYAPVRIADLFAGVEASVDESVSIRVTELADATDATPSTDGLIYESPLATSAPRTRALRGQPRRMANARRPTDRPPRFDSASARGALRPPRLQN